MNEDFEMPPALEVLADETRLRILFALADRLRKDPDEPTVRFAPLRKTVGMRDSGNFNYHLDRLRGTFIEQTEDGYTLTTRGIRVVSALSTGTYDEQPEVEPFDLDEDCPLCGEPLTGRYDDGSFTVGCPNDHAIKNFLPASVVTDRPLDEILRYFVGSTLLAAEQIVEGFCGLCGGEVRQLELEGEPEPDMGFQFTCQQCGVPFQTAPNAVALVHPAVTWFMYDHGVDLREEPMRTIRLALEAESTVASSDPPRWLVTFEMNGDTLELTVDETASVIDVHR